MAVTDKHSQFINETEKPRQMLYNPNIKSADKAWSMSFAKLHGINEIYFVSSC